MNKKKYVAFIIIIIVICILPFAGMIFARTDSTSENKKLSSWPVIKDENGINSHYLEDMGSYFTDHFAFKEYLVALNAKLQGSIFGVSAEDDVIMGSDGWLYYTATLDDYQHKNSVSERMLYNMAHNTKLMQEYTELLGKQYVFTIAPNKNSLYGDNMPNRYKYIVSEKSDAQRLVPYLEEEGVNYVDLYSLFNSQDEILYYKQDSHWTEKGAVMVYNKLLDYANIDHYDYSDVIPSSANNHIGDLAAMEYASMASAEEELRYIQYEKYVYENGSSVEDVLINTYNEGGRGNLLMYRDSFGNSLLPYFANEFEKAQFSKVVPYPMTDLVTTEADLVIVEKVERHLPTLAEVPPVMAAPLREGFEYNNMSDSLALLSVNDNGIYYEISGEILSDDMPDKANIYLVINDGDTSNTYEAFLVGKKADGGYTDKGFKAYISSLNKLPGDTVVEIVTDLGNGYVKVYEGKLF